MALGQLAEKCLLFTGTHTDDVTLTWRQRTQLFEVVLELGLDRPGPQLLDEGPKLQDLVAEEKRKNQGEQRPGPSC